MEEHAKEANRLRAETLDRQEQIRALQAAVAGLEVDRTTAAAVHATELQQAIAAGEAAHREALEASAALAQSRADLERLQAELASKSENADRLSEKVGGLQHELRAKAEEVETLQKVQTTNYSPILCHTAALTLQHDSTLCACICLGWETACASGEAVAQVNHASDLELKWEDGVMYCVLCAYMDGHEATNMRDASWVGFSYELQAGTR